MVLISVKCAKCERIFVSEEALNQHSNAKHGIAAVPRQTEYKKPSKMKYSLIGIPLIALIGYFAFSGLAPASTTGFASLSVAGEPFKGDENAPVVIEAFEDPQCPFCQRFTTTILPEIERNYINTGKVKFVFRQFPIPNAHPWAIPASVALECAFLQDEDSFWDLHDFYYQRQFSLTSHNLRQETLSVLHDKDIDIEQFSQCFDNQQTLDEVNQDYADGVSKGVGGTPTFFVNGQKIVGAQPYPVWVKLIESELAKI